MNRRARDRLRRAAPLALVGLLLCCDPTEPPSGSRAASLEVEISRCWAFYWPAAVCALWPGADPKLRLWVKAEPGAKVEIRADGVILPAEGEAAGGGFRYRPSIPRQASLLTVAATSPDGRRAEWSLALAASEAPAWMAGLGELEKPAAHRRLLELLETAPREERTYVLRSLADLSRDDPEREADHLRYLRQGIALDRAENRLSAEVEKTGWLLRFYLDHSRFEEARKTLQGLQLPAEAPAESKYFLAFYRGLLGEAVGNFREALEQLGIAVEVAQRMGRKEYRRFAEQILSRVLQSLGRSQEAAERFERLVAEGDPSEPCGSGTLLTNAGWSLLLAGEAGERTKDPLPMLQRARATFDDGGCAADERLNARLNLALAYEQAGRWPEARRVLEEARKLPAKPNREAELWWTDLAARALIHAGRPEEALDLFQKLERTAERYLSLEGRLRASIGQANANLALARRAAALRALDDAERWIDEQSWLIPVHEGRETFVAQRQAVTRLHLEILIQDRQVDRAFALARKARSRLLRQVTVADRLSQLTPPEQQAWYRSISRYTESRATADRMAVEAWKLPRDRMRDAQAERESHLAEARKALDAALNLLGAPGETHEAGLSPPAAGEVILLYHPLREDWAGFAATTHGIDFAQLKLPAPLPSDPERQARDLLAPFQATIEASPRVRVLPFGPLRSVDFHVLPFAGEPLFKRHVVVYGLDLPVPSTASPPRLHEALLVTDPTGDLPAAKQEGDELSSMLEEAGWKQRRLDGRAALAGPVLRALAGVELFHYAGHGEFGGFAGWESTLKLADESRLMLGDILTLERAPVWVVLSSCEGGRSSEQSPVEGVGLAHAFLLAGSRAVIAATDRVDDRPARDLMRALYRDWRPGLDLPRQFQRAQIAQSRSPRVDWRRFRVLVP